MNWKIRQTGSKAEIIAAIAAQSTAGTLPKEVATAIDAIAQATPVPDGQNLNLWAYGYTTDGRTGISKMDAWAEGVAAPHQAVG